MVRSKKLTTAASTVKTMIDNSGVTSRRRIQSTPRIAVDAMSAALQPTILLFLL